MKTKDQEKSEAAKRIIDAYREFKRACEDGIRLNIVVTSILQSGNSSNPSIPGDKVRSEISVIECLMQE